MNMKLKEVTSLLKQVVMIYRYKIENITFGEMETKLRSNNSLKLDNTKLKWAHNRPQKIKEVNNPRRGSC